MNRYSKNSFLDEDRDERPVSRPASSAPRQTVSVSRQSAGAPRSAGGGRGPRKPVKKNGLPIGLVIAIDVVIAALALLVFSLFYFIIPHDRGQNTVVLPTPPRTETQQASQSPEDSAVATESTTATLEPTTAVNMGDFGAKFPDKFTNGEVEKTDTSYRSANINVTIQKHEENGVTYYVADIYVKNLECFRTAFAQDTFGYTDPTNVIAQQKDAIIAINGDYCVNNAGPVVRNGEMPRAETYSSDVLVMGWDGVMTTYSPEEFDLAKVQTEGAWQVWTFGPMLLKDGQPMTEFNSSVNKANPRTAIGYYEPGHYCFVVIDGRQEGYSVGMTTAQMSQLFADMGCTVAYNLDGGQTSEMAYMGDMVNQPVDGGRSVSDIVYIADIAGE